MSYERLKIELMHKMIKIQYFDLKYLLFLVSLTTYRLAGQQPTQLKSKL